MFIGTRVAPRSAYVVGWSGTVSSGPPYPTEKGQRAAPTLHAVNSRGYPVCDAGRVTYVLLQRVWTSTVDGACEKCAEVIATQRDTTHARG